MDVKEKAKILLQYDGKIIDIGDLPLGVVTEFTVGQIETVSTFGNKYMLNDNRFVELDVNIKIKGNYEDVAYLYDMKKCAIVPYPES